MPAPWFSNEAGAVGYMLETPRIRRYQICHERLVRFMHMIGDKPFGAVDQQERPGLEQWVVGFVDGEGCFSISVVRNSGLRLGWQVQHEFSISQLASSRQALEFAGAILGVGRIIENRRRDSHRETMMRLSVKKRSELIEVIIPFFESNPLVTAKRNDFELLCRGLRLIDRGAHLDRVGLRQIAELTERMNRRRRSRYLESSEAIRQPSRSDNSR